MQKGLHDTYELAIEKDEGTTVQGKLLVGMKINIIYESI